MITTIVVLCCCDKAADSPEEEPPGKNWSVIETGSSTAYEAIAASRVGFVVVGFAESAGDSGIVSFSADGISWTRSNLGSGIPLKDVVWTGDVFATVGTGNLYTSADGTSWSELVDLSQLAPLASISFSGDRYAVICGDRYDRVAWSEDPRTWNTVELALYPLVKFNQITWAGGQLVAVGVADSGSGPQALVATSDDANDWTLRILDQSGQLTDIAWTFNRYVAVGSTGLIVSSREGFNWYTQDSPVRTDLLGVCYTGSNCVAVGVDGVVLTSKYGITWTKQASGTTSELTCVAYYGGKLVAAGESVIIMSDD